MAGGMIDADLSTLLRGMQPLVSGLLIDSRGWERLSASVGGLPAPLGIGFGFEFRLGKERPECDLYLWAQRRSPWWDRVLDRAQAADADPATVILAGLISRIDESKSLRGPDGSDRLDTILVEYDIAEVPRGEHRVPGFFARPRHPDGSVGQDLDALLAVAGWADDCELRQATAMMAGSLRNQRIKHLAAMPDRTPRALRCIVSGVEARDAPALLEELCGAGPVERTRDLLTAIGGLLPRLQIALDSTATGLLPRVGLELFPHPDHRNQDGWLVTDRSDWLPVLKQLESMALCLPDKAVGLLAFPGRDQLLDSAGVFSLYRGINHIKLSIDGDSNVEAKAYTGVAVFQPR